MLRTKLKQKSLLANLTSTRSIITKGDGTVENGSSKEEGAGSEVFFSDWWGLGFVGALFSYLQVHNIVLLTASYSFV